MNKCIDCKWCEVVNNRRRGVQKYQDACTSKAAYRYHEYDELIWGYYISCSYMRKRYGEDCPYFAEIPPRKWWQIWRKK